MSIGVHPSAGFIVSTGSTHIQTYPSLLRQWFKRPLLKEGQKRRSLSWTSFRHDRTCQSPEAGSGSARCLGQTILAPEHP